MPHRRSPPLAGLIVSSLGLVDALGENLSVLVLPKVSTEVLNECEVGERTAASLEASARRRLSATLWRLCWRR